MPIPVIALMRFVEYNSVPSDVGTDWVNAQSHYDVPLLKLDRLQY
ncbi:hypothetical protein RINTHM_15370 [Richelia intracellularis HM01]|nr:hypothetical protein RINTHM_15370 [Richelia intracellularis HM01]